MLIDNVTVENNTFVGLGTDGAAIVHPSKNVTHLLVKANTPAGVMPPPPAPPGPPRSPSTVLGFCLAAATEPCIAALTSPITAPQQCTGGYQHVEQHALNRSNGAGPVTLEALMIDVAGNGHRDMKVRGVIYSDVENAPGMLLGSSEVVTVTAKAKRAWVKLPLTTKAPPPLAAGGVYWLGQMSVAVASGDSEARQPPGATDLACFGWNDAATNPLHRPCKYTAQPFSAGPKPSFGHGATCGGESIDVFGTFK